MTAPAADAPPPLPWTAGLGPVFDERTDGPTVPLDAMLDRLRRRFPELTADVAAGDARTRARYAKLKAMGAPDVLLGPWETRLGTEPLVTLDAAGAAVTFPLAAIGNAHLEAVHLDLAEVRPHDGSACDAARFVSVCDAVAEALGFGVWLSVSSCADEWGIGIDARRNVRDAHADLREGLPAWTSYGVNGPKMPRPTSFLPDRGADRWPAACRRAAAGWCGAKGWCGTDEPVRSRAPMIAAYGGVDGVATAILRDLSALGPITAFREHVTGAPFENTAVVTCGDWTVTARFNGVPTGLLRD